LYGAPGSGGANAAPPHERKGTKQAVEDSKPFISEEQIAAERAKLDDLERDLDMRSSDVQRSGREQDNQRKAAALRDVIDSLNHVDQALHADMPNSSTQRSN
jgi:predicted component of type VI protein secretion system